MNEPTFRQALSNSWDLVKQKKSLWIFGLLSAVIGQWGMSDFLGALLRTVRNGLYVFNWQDLTVYFTVWNWHKVTVVLGVLWLLGIILLLLFSLIFIAVCSRAAIITYAIHWYKNGKILALHDAWNKGVKKFFPLLGITAVSRLLQFLILGLFAVCARKILQYDNLGMSMFLILLVALSVLLALLIEAGSIYASGYVSLENKSLKKSLQKGFELLSDHLMVSLELGLVLVLFNVIFLGVAIYGSFLAFVPSIFMWLVAGFSGYDALIAFGSYAGIILYTMIVLIAAGIFNAFVTCSWVYMFMKMHHEGVLSRTVIYLKKFFRIE